MGKDRLFPSEGIIYQYLLGGIGQMVFSPYHMGYTHEVVIYHNRKVIGGHAIGLLYYQIASQGVRVDLDPSLYYIVEDYG
jgi:hypothetical protein